MATSNDQLHREFGAMDARLTNVEKKQDEIGKDVKAIRTAIDEAKGGKKALWVLLSACALLSSLLTAAGTYLTLKQ